jgi:hypothetical protein
VLIPTPPEELPGRNDKINDSWRTTTQSLINSCGHLPEEFSAPTISVVANTQFNNYAFTLIILGLAMP